MKITCPECDKTLKVADDFGGRRVKCPGCEHVFSAPATGAAITPADRPKPAKPTAPASPGVKKGPPPLPARSPCPECGAPLSLNASECPECDWVAGKSKTKSARAVARTDDGGGCYINIRRDEVELNEAIETRMKAFIESEQLDMQVMDASDPPPDELGPNDVVISGRVNVCDYGSQFMRYFFTFVTMFGPGSCQLEVEAEVETPEGKPKAITAKSRHGIGVFGGSGTGLMKLNVKNVSTRIATEAARHITGRSFLNAHVYSCAYWSLGLGITSLIPFVALLAAPAGAIVGLIALVTIKRRELPRGKNPTITGLALSAVGFLVTLGIIGYLIATGA